MSSGFIKCFFCFMLQRRSPDVFVCHHASSKHLNMLQFMGVKLVGKIIIRDLRLVLSIFIDQLMRKKGTGYKCIVLEAFDFVHKVGRGFVQSKHLSYCMNPVYLLCLYVWTDVLSPNYILYKKCVIQPCGNLFIAYTFCHLVSDIIDLVFSHDCRSSSHPSIISQKLMDDMDALLHCCCDKILENLYFATKTNNLPCFGDWG